MRFEELNIKLDEMKFDTFHFYFATNTIGFQFFNKNGNKDYLLIINPHWRIVKKKIVINSSLSCPWHEDYENQVDYSVDFKLWCESAAYLKKIPISQLRINNSLGDLEILWKDGSKLETFISYPSEDQWYFEHENDLKRYVVGKYKVMVENIQRKQKA